MGRSFLGLAVWKWIVILFVLGSMIAIAIALRRRRRRRISNAAPDDASLGEYTHPHPLSVSALMAAHTAAGGDTLEENSYEPPWMQVKHN